MSLGNDVNVPETCCDENTFLSLKDSINYNSEILLCYDGKVFEMHVFGMYGFFVFCLGVAWHVWETHGS